MAVSAQAVRNHREIQSNESAILLSELMQQPDDFLMSVERYLCSVVSIVGWGRRIKRKDDPIVERALNIMHVRRHRTNICSWRLLDGDHSVASTSS
jgi:hypothetical protein